MTGHQMTVQIGPASAADIDAIHELETDAFPSPWRREFFETELEASGRLCLVATSGKLAGYLFAMWLFEEMHINKIAVATKVRRCGVARKLMENCVEFAHTNGVTSISLEVRASNAGAQSFYRTIGFEARSIRRRYYPDGEDAVVMVQDL